MSQAIKVGIFVTICLVMLGYLVLKVEDIRLFAGGGRHVEALFDSVAGMDDKAAVRVAGVRVGRVDGITLDGGRARVRLLLEQPVELGEGTRVRIVNTGLLGDKYVELVPGPPGAPPLPEGAVLPGETAPSFDQALEKFSALGDSLQEVTGDLAGHDLGATLARLLDNLEATSADIRALVAANRGQLDATVGNFERFSATLAQELPLLTGQMRELLAQVDAVVAENRQELAGSLENIQRVTERMQTSVDNLNAISDQIASGEGTLGKLIYSDEAHTGLVSTLDSVQEGVGVLSDTLGRVGKIEFHLGLEGSYFAEPEESRTAVRLDIEPRDDRFYRVELVDDPFGKVETKTEIITTTLPDGTVETTTIERTTIDDDFTLSAQFGFTFGRADLRAGLFESSGGAAVDYHLLDRRLKLSLEAFDFSRRNDLDPHLRFTTRWQLHPNLYLLGGYDDFLVGERESLFLGAGVTWRDDDLKYLLGSVPRF